MKEKLFMFTAFNGYNFCVNAHNRKTAEAVAYEYYGECKYKGIISREFAETNDLEIIE